jgi:hypothetical protein
MSIESLAVYFLLSWEILHPSFYTNTLTSAIYKHKFDASLERIVGGLVISIFGIHNISTTWFSVIITETPCTTNSMVFTFNRTIDYKSSLMIGCLMGVSLKVVTLASPINFARATSLLATQC